MSVINTISKKMASKNFELNIKHNSLFGAIALYGEDSDIVEDGCTGLSKEVSSDMNLFRNTILPITKELEVAVKSKATVKTTTISDVVNTHIYEYRDGLNLITTVYNLDQNVTASYADLPEKPLIIEYDKDVINDNFTNSRIKESIQEIVLEYGETYLEDLHNRIFSNVSNRNKTIMNICLTNIETYTDAYTGLVLVMGYINGNGGVSNMSWDKATNNYLYTLRDIFTTASVTYSKLYKQLLSNGCLITGVQTKDKITSVYILGETYAKYLESNNVDSIIGYAYDIKNAGRVSLNDFLSKVPQYTAYYEESIRIDMAASAASNIRVLKLAYKVASREHLDEMSADALDSVALAPSMLSGVNDDISKYVDSLTNEQLLDVTSITRTIVGKYIYDNDEFMMFISHIDYYHKMFPGSTINEVATAAMVAHVFDKLDNQLVLSRTSNRV